MNKKFVHVLFGFMIAAQAAGTLGFMKPVTTFSRRLFGLGGNFTFFTGPSTESLLKNYPVIEARLHRGAQAQTIDLLSRLPKGQHNFLLRISAHPRFPSLQGTMAKNWAQSLFISQPDLDRVDTKFKHRNLLENERREDAHVMYQASFTEKPFK